TISCSDCSCVPLLLRLFIRASTRSRHLHSFPTRRSSALNNLGDCRKFWALVRALNRLGKRANVCNNLADFVAGRALTPVALELVKGGIEVFSLAGFLLPDARHLRVGI